MPELGDPEESVGLPPLELLLPEAVEDDELSVSSPFILNCGWLDFLLPVVFRVPVYETFKLQKNIFISLKFK